MCTSRRSVHTAGMAQGAHLHTYVSGGSGHGMPGLSQICPSKTINTPKPGLKGPTLRPGFVKSQ